MYMHVHQPYRLGKFTFFDIGTGKSYWDEEKNKEILNRVVRKSYLPTTRLLLELMKETNGAFRAAFSITGTVLEQLKKYGHEEVISNFHKLIDKGCEIVDETYYHSLAFLFSRREFREQVKMHRELVQELFGVKPKVFRNTELVYSNEIAKEAEKMGYRGILAEGHEKVLGWRSPCFVYRAKDANIRILLRHYKLSDDISFRFSLHTWEEYPLTADKFASWINAHNGNGEVVNLFMDFETFGEHQWPETGIFEFLRYLPKEILKHPDNEFVTPYEAIRKFPERGELDVPFIVSWADTERDLTAWLGNRMQQYALQKLYELEERVLATKDSSIIEDWRKLQISDHFYFMCTKWFADGDVHKYFNPYDTPYDAFINFMNVIEDLKRRIEEVENHKITRDVAIKFLGNVRDGEEFYCCDGRVFRNLRELAEGLKCISPQAFSHHVNPSKNDFAAWIANCIGDVKLAEKISKLNDPKLMRRAILDRIRYLKKFI
jgi:alpha-amylase